MSPAKVVRTVQEQALHDVRESDLQAEVIKLARQCGWGTTLSARKAMLAEAGAYRVEAPPLDGLIYHPRYSLGSEPGWPDLVLVRARDRRLVFAELKTEKGRLSARQVEVLDLLRTIAGEGRADPRPFGGEWLLPRGVVRIEVTVWRPSDLASGAIAEVLR